MFASQPDLCRIRAERRADDIVASRAESDWCTEDRHKEREASKQQRTKSGNDDDDEFIDFDIFYYYYLSNIRISVAV